MENIQEAQGYRHLRMGSVCLALVVYLGTCVVAYELGSLQPRPAVAVGLLAFFAAGAVVFHALVFFEVNLQFRDPDLALLQLMWALTIVVVTASLAEQARPLLLVSGVCLVVFAAGDLRRADRLVFACFAGGLYLLVRGIEFYYRPLAVSPSIEATAFATYLLVILFAPHSLRLSVRVYERRLKEQKKELEKARTTHEEYGLTDLRTGLPNRRHIRRLTRYQIALAERTKSTFTVCQVGLYRSDRLPDRFGRDGRDRLFRALVRMAGRQVRAIDFMGRYEEDVLTIILVRASAGHAVAILRRLAAALADAPELVEGVEVTLGISAGVAESGSDGSEQLLLDRARRALTDTARLGRNEVVVAVEEIDREGNLEAGAGARQTLVSG